MNQNEREGQSMGRTTGASSEQAEEQQNRTIEGQDTEPGNAWQESDKSQYTGHGDTNVGGSDPRGGSNPDVVHDTKDEQPENLEIDETQWQGNRFGQGGFGGNQGGGSNG